MNLFPQRGEYLDCNFLNAAIGSLIAPRVRHLRRNPLDKKGIFDDFVLPDRKAAKRKRHRGKYSLSRHNLE